MCACVCLCALCTHVCVRVCVHMCGCARASVCVCMCVCVHVCLCVHTCERMCVCPFPHTEGRIQAEGRGVPVSELGALSACTSSHWGVRERSSVRPTCPAWPSGLWPAASPSAETLDPDGRRPGNQPCSSLRGWYRPGLAGEWERKRAFAGLERLPRIGWSHVCEGRGWRPTFQGTGVSWVCHCRSWGRGGQGQAVLGWKVWLVRPWLGHQGHRCGVPVLGWSGVLSFTAL